MRLAEFFYYELGPIRIDGPARWFRRFLRRAAEGLAWGLGLGLGLGLGFALAALIFCRYSGVDSHPALEKASRWAGSILRESLVLAALGVDFAASGTTASDSECRSSARPP